MLMVPQGTPHMMVPDAGGPLVLATLHMPRTGRARAGSRPRACRAQAGQSGGRLPAMIAKSQGGRGDLTALLRRRHAAVPAALSRRAGIPVAQGHRLGAQE